MKRLVQSLGLVGLLAACGNSAETENKEEAPIVSPYTIENPVPFARISLRDGTGVGITSGDFDGDGDLDIVIVSRTEDYVGKFGSGRVYHFKNDGQGNFYQDSLKE